MKISTHVFVSLASACIVTAEPAYLTWHPYTATDSTNTVACSDGANGLQEQFGYFDLSAMFPNVAAVSNVHWNSPNCGLCYKISSGENSVYVTAIDYSTGGGPSGEVHFDMAPGAFEALLGSLDAGTAYAEYELVDGSFCPGNLGGSSTGGTSGGSSSSSSDSGDSSSGSSQSVVGTCGGGSVGNGVCPQAGYCCSQWGWCGTTSNYCSGQTQSTPAPVQPATPAPVPASVPVASSGSNRMMAYMGSWHACPTAQQLAQYTHIVIAFAVSYTWAPGQNVCSQTCDINTPHICDHAANAALLSELKAMGKKIIVSFGGAGMGGSWAGDNNNCWDYCYGRETQVVDRLKAIVEELGADGVDIDYEYFYEDNQNGSGFTKGVQAQNFLKQVTVGLRNALPSHAEITHVPMDSDLESHTAYFQLLKEISHTLDFIMPQYYNGVTRPALDGLDGTGVGSISALDHYNTLADEFFGGDATRVIFGFCISDCSGTSSNANGQQAAQVMIDLSKSHSCNGGAFFWVANDDRTGKWSTTVNQAIISTTACSSPAAPGVVPVTPAPVAVVPVTPAPVNAPQTPAPVTPVPTPLPTNAPVSSSSPDTPNTEPCCPPGYSGLLAFNECRKYHHCSSGEVLGSPMTCPSGTLFDNTMQYCNWINLVSCAGNAACR